MSTVSCLVPIDDAERIRRKKAQYCRFLDTKQWDQLEALALPDATFTFYGIDGGIYEVAGIRFSFGCPSEFTQRMASLFSEARTSHRISNSELELLPSGEVSAIWAMEDRLILKPVGGCIPFNMRGNGHYHEIWVQKDDDWYLKKLELERTVIEYNLAARLLLKMAALRSNKGPNMGAD